MAEMSQHQTGLLITALPVPLGGMCFLLLRRNFFCSDQSPFPIRYSAGIIPGMLFQHVKSRLHVTGHCSLNIHEWVVPQRAHRTEEVVADPKVPLAGVSSKLQLIRE